jgi:mono/diheme cytochrome c family protein
MDAKKPQARSQKPVISIRWNARAFYWLLATGSWLLVAAGCERNDMHNQPRHEPLEPSSFFADGQSSRPQVAGTVAREQNLPNDMRFAGIASGPTPDVFPFEITKADLKRGKQRYEIYCGVCHGVAGDGNGMIVQRGFVPPPSFHEQRLRDVPVGHFFNVITNGFGAMYSYNDRIVPEDRWRIAAYVRVLQLSQQQALASAASGASARPASATESGSPAGPADPVLGAVERVTGEAESQPQDQPPQGQQPQQQPERPEQPEQPPAGQPQPPQPGNPQ